MQLQNALMGKEGKCGILKRATAGYKAIKLQWGNPGKGKEVKRNGHRTRARERGRKGNKSHHHHHHQDTTTGREIERFPWAVPRGKGATVSVKYKTQCPPAGGGSRCWDWFGIPWGRRVQLGAENPARERGERLALEGAVRSTGIIPTWTCHVVGRSLQSWVRWAGRWETEAL